jgi:hypothetical protein
MIEESIVACDIEKSVRANAAGRFSGYYFQSNGEKYGVKYY